jgi:SAM-dependent methyltransferase
LNPEPQKYWEDVYEEWRADSRHATWRCHSDAVYTRLLQVFLPAPLEGRILKTDAFDEAVSRGIVEVLRAPSARVHIADLSLEMLKSAKRQHAWLLPAVSEVRQFPFPADSFDIVLSLSTLDHLESLEEVLRGLQEFFRILKEGGRLILTFDNRANPLMWLRSSLPFEWLHKLGLVPYRMGVSCGPARLGRLAKEAGFRVDFIGATFHSPRVLMVSLARLIDWIGNPRLHSSFVNSARVFERLSNWPTRFLTGHMIVISARKLD